MEMPIRLAKTTERMSMPSMAPPKRMVRPLPMPEMTPPKMAQSSRSVPASGETKATSMGNTFMIKNDMNE